MDGRGRKPRAHDLLELFGVVSRPAARASERETGADDRGVLRLFDYRFGLGPRVREAAARHRQSLLLHRALEQLAVFRDAYRLALRADHLDAELPKHAFAVEGHREV